METVFFKSISFLDRPFCFPAEEASSEPDDAVLAFLFVTALKYGYSFRRNLLKSLLIGLVPLTIFFAWGTYHNAFGPQGYWTRQQADWWPFKYEKNCYPIADWGGRKVRWCSQGAFVQIPVRGALPPRIQLTLGVHHPDLSSKPVTVKYGGRKGAFHEIVVEESSWQTVELPVTRDDIVEVKLPNMPLRKYFVLSLDVSRTWIPKEWGVNEDGRELGVALMLPNL